MKNYLVIKCYYNDSDPNSGSIVFATDNKADAEAYVDIMNRNEGKGNVRFFAAVRTEA